MHTKGMGNIRGYKGKQRVLEKAEACGSHALGIELALVAVHGSGSGSAVV